MAWKATLRQIAGRIRGIGKSAPRRRLGRFGRDSSAVAAIEFALMSPLLILVTLGMVDLAFAFYAQLRANSALSAAAHHAFASHDNVTAGTVPTYLSRIELVLSSRLPASINARLQVLYNGSNTAANSANYYCLTGTPATLSSTGASISNCGGDVLSGRYVTIKLDGDALSFFSTGSVLAGQFSLSETVHVRVE